MNDKRAYPLVGTCINIPLRNEIENEILEFETFKIIRVLGRGGFGTVYLGHSCTRDFKVAIKVMHKKNEDIFNRVIKEANIQQELVHEHILRLYTICEIDNIFYLVLEFCGERNLKKYLECQPNGKLSEADARNFLGQLVRGLLFLHSKKIMHRDISLANLLLTEDSKIKIADFGLASQLSHPKAKQTSICGTLNYMAPEMKTKQPYGLESDVWGVGCIFYHMITGKPIFESLPLKLASDISPAAHDLLSKMLQKDPAQRIDLKDVHSLPFFTNYTKYNADHQSSSAMDSGFETNSSRSSVPSSNISNSRRKETSTPANANYKLFHQDINLPSPIKKSCTPGRLFQSPNFSNRTEESIVEKYYIQNDDKCRQSGSVPNSCQYGQERNFHLFSKNISKPSFNSPNNPTNVRTNSPSTSRESPINILKTRLDGNLYVGDQHQSCSNHSNDSNYMMNEKRKDRNISSPHRLKETRRLQAKDREDTQRSINSNNRKQYGSAYPIDKNVQNAPFSRSEKILSNQNNSKKCSKRPDAPLYSTRLPPHEYRAANKIFKILASGEVLVEVLTKHQEESFDCCKISPDGKQIVVFKRFKEIQIDHVIFSFENLPPEHFQKYKWGSTFCNLIRSRTAKITYHDPLATFKLMENTDFEGEFNTKEKILLTGKTVKITDADGNIVEGPVSDLPSNLKKLLSTFNKYHEECKQLEEITSKINPGLFPLICGRKVKSTTILNNNINNKENIHLRRRNI